MNVREIYCAIKENNFEWRKHSLARLAERQISQDEILKVILDGEVIENYPQDKPFPSCLIFKMIGIEPWHVVVSFDLKLKKAYIITVYQPNLDKFESDFKTRRR